MSVSSITIPYNPTVELSAESTEILQKLRLVNTPYFFRPDASLVSKLRVINPVELTKLLQCFFSQLVRDGAVSDPVAFLDRLTRIVPLAKLQEAVKGDVPDALKEAKGMFEEAKLYLQTTQGKISLTLRVRLESIFDRIISVIESILNGFGCASFFMPSEGDLRDDFKSDKIMMLLHLSSMVATMIFPLLGAATGALVIGGTLLTISALSLIWPFIKPRPSQLPNAVNLTKQVQHGGFVGQGRKESLDRIANILKRNRHALLVGPSRVGKSLTAKAFALAVARGDYAELKGKTVFYFNTTELVGQKASFMGGGNTILNRIKAAMARHRDGIILVFDEIHMACKDKAKIADQLKTFLDPEGGFPHVIGITTEAEYESQIKKNTAFSLRFDPVAIQNTGRDETLKILSDRLLQSPPTPLMEAGALDQMYEASGKDAPQPATSVKLLERCIGSIERTQKTPAESKRIELENKISSLRSQALLRCGKKNDDYELIGELEGEVQAVRATERKEQAEVEALFASRELLGRVTKEMYQSVVKISSVASKTLNTKGEKQLKLFLLLHTFLGQILESHIKEKSKALGIKAVIDSSLIKEMAATVC